MMVRVMRVLELLVLVLLLLVERFMRVGFYVDDGRSRRRRASTRIGSSGAEGGKISGK